MSDSEIVINVKGPSELKLQLTINTDKTVADLKQAYCRQDDDQLSVYKIQSSHTIPHGQRTVHDPLTQLNSHMGYGVMAGLNPFADMGVNPNDPNMVRLILSDTLRPYGGSANEQLQSMMNSPEFLQQMSSMMSNPAIFEQALPQAREMFQSDRFRQMMSNPETLRSMIQMASMMRSAGIDPLAGPLGGPTQSGFPAPGNPTPQAANTASAPAAPGATPAASGTAPVPNPFGPLGDPSALMQLLGGAGGAGFGPGVGASPLPGAPPPEERFQVQLQVRTLTYIMAG
ncbi:hypothetical protein H4582DRAFT_1940935 [Lactarius indigo]|nr:hypothetical protein H4582DRAFT_1940935 [Lactarius indigo]